MTGRIIAKLKPYLTPLTLSLAGFLLITIGFVGLADSVNTGETLAIDRAVLETVNSSATAELDQFFVTATAMGGKLATAVIAIGIVGLLLLRRRIRSAIIVGGTVAGATVSVYLLKLLFVRPRPELWQTLVDEQTYSFPSGHAIASSALALSLIVVLWSSRWRWLAIILGTTYAVLIGYSRLYLGVHYPSDVIGSWLLSGAWLIVVYQITIRSAELSLRR